MGTRPEPPYHEISMQCLYCGERLSLIKSWKGETFCSDEHQDLHRKREAAASIERIIGRPRPERIEPLPPIREVVEPEPFSTMAALPEPEHVEPPPIALYIASHSLAPKKPPLVPEFAEPPQPFEFTGIPVHPRLSETVQTEAAQPVTAADGPRRARKRNRRSRKPAANA